MPALAYVAFGSNEGEREKNIVLAVEMLGAISGIRVLRTSRMIETKPVDCPPESNDFLNGVVEIETELLPRELLSALLDIERALGRVRSHKNAPRPIDLDIILYGKEILDAPDLTLPHPRMRERAFVLDPLLELAPDIRDPRTKELFSAIRAQLNVNSHA
jgi:2-amino-4-hydroxy-6-hydroxymethyldihydropteridine diphosphokinase